MARKTDSDIEAAIRTIASVIDRFGDAYWPLLERLEQELQARHSRAARLHRYLRKDDTSFQPSWNLEITKRDLKMERRE